MSARFSRLKRLSPFLVTMAAIVGIQLAVMRYDLYGLKIVHWAVYPFRHLLIGACVGAVIIAVDGRSSTFLDARPLAKLGMATYSIYVVQQAFCLPPSSERASWQTPPWSILGALTLGIVCYGFIEEPLRRRIVARLGLSRRVKTRSP